MRKQGGGRIINLSTGAAHTPLQTMHDYSSAKAGLRAFSKSAAFELAPDNTPRELRLPGANSFATLGEACGLRPLGSLVPAVTKFTDLANQFVRLKRFGNAKRSVGTHRIPCFRSGIFHYGKSFRRRWRDDQIDMK
jgi:NAD(P)-dependent dehydrogenase (short-subunit alcohol dehydrogenase family)